MTLVLYSRLVQIVHAFPSTQILVIGDVLLDTYLACNALGIANEAPVPLLEIASQTHAPGGAGNVALNLARLGVRTELVGMIGDDREGQTVKQFLNEAGIRFEPQVIHRPTPHKTRILSGQHYYLRLDEEDPTALSESETASLGRAIDQAVESNAALIVSDYDKGMVTELLARGVEISARRRTLPIYADLKPKNASHWNQLRLITPNLIEARELLARQTLTQANLEVPEELATRLSQKFHCDVVLKMAGQGMVAANAAGVAFRLEACCTHPKNVSGAGDTVVSTLSAALTCGASLQEASVLANLAAGIAVSYEATYAVPAEELLAVVKNQPGSGIEV